MNKTVFRGIKIKQSQQVAASGAHCYRIKETLNADRSVKNIAFCRPTDKNLAKAVNERILQSGVKVRKSKPKTIEQKTKAGKTITRTQDASSVLCLEFVASASPSYFNGMNQKQLKAFGRDVTDFFKKEFGTENLMSSVLHLDEQTPHLHVHVTPITRDGRLSAKDWLGGAQKCSELQQRFQDFMQSKGHDLTRNAGSKAKHQDIKQFYSVVNKSKESQQSNLFMPLKNVFNANQIAKANKMLASYKELMFQRYPLQNKKLIERNKKLRMVINDREKEIKELTKKLSNVMTQGEEQNKKYRDEFNDKVKILNGKLSYYKKEQDKIKKIKDVIKNKDYKLYREAFMNHHNDGCKPD